TGCLPGGAPASASESVTTLSHRSGSPASVSNPASRNAVSGVCGAGLSTTGQPAAIAGASLWATVLSGKLNGVIAATTPTGSRIARPSRPTPAGVDSVGTTSPPSVRASAAANRNVSA